MAEAIAYLQVEPVWSPYSAPNGDPRISHIKVTKALQSPPGTIKGVVIKVRLRIPDTAFTPLRPVVTVEVPEEALTYEPVVTVEMPDGDDG